MARNLKSPKGSVRAAGVRENAPTGLAATRFTRRTLQAACFPVGAAMGLAFVSPVAVAAPGVPASPSATAPADSALPVSAAPAPAQAASSTATASSTVTPPAAPAPVLAAPPPPVLTVPAPGVPAAPASAPSLEPASPAPAAPAPAASAIPAPLPAPAATSSAAAASLSAPSSDPTLVLPAVRVEGDTESYRRTESQISRVATPLLNTPQTVAVVTKEVLQEQRASTVRDALRNVSGITMSAGEGGRQGDTFILRGFSAQNDMFRDGARDLGWFTRDTFNLEGVEVFFGPSSVIFGRGSTGGAINLISKAPRRGTFAEVSLGAGTAPHGRVEADANHTFGNGIGLRLSAMGQRSSVAGRDEVKQNRAGVAPSLRFVLGDHTTLSLDYLYQRERSIPDYGLPYYNGRPVSEDYGVSRGTFYGVTGAGDRSDTENVDAHISSARLQHDFNANVRLSNTFRAGSVDRLARPTAPRNLAPAVDPTSIGRQRFESDVNNANVLNQTDVRVQGATGFAKHTANFGLELAWEQRKQTRWNLQVPGATGNALNISADLRNPDPSPDVSGLNRVYGSFQRGVMKTAALYASDQVTLLPQLEVLGSVRLDSFDTNYRSIAPDGKVSPLSNDDVLVNWRSGVVVHPQEKTSVYAMVGSSSNPSAEAGTLSDATVSLDPEKNLAYEVGAKADVLSDHLNLGVSAFRIEKRNARVAGTDPLGPAQVLSGKQRVQGINVGAAGTLTPDWKLIASYTYLRSRIRSHTNPFLIGQKLPGSVPHSLSLWTTYTIFNRVTVGGGAVFMSETPVNNPTAAMQLFNELPSFWRFDAFASYELPKVAFQLNVSNLTNALYYDQHSGSQAVPAEGRVVLATARMRL